MLAVGIVVPLSAPDQAAVPNVFGFATWNGGIVNMFPGGGIAPIPAGRYDVTFKGIGVPRGIVPVTAMSKMGNWCQAEGWTQMGPGERVTVLCFDVMGARRAGVKPR
jgi:hypothetical protein